MKSWFNRFTISPSFSSKLRITNKECSFAPGLLCTHNTAKQKVILKSVRNVSVSVSPTLTYTASQRTALIKFKVTCFKYKECKYFGLYNSACIPHILRHVRCGPQLAKNVEIRLQNLKN